MVMRDDLDRLGLYLDWLRRRLPGWQFSAECNEGQMGWIGVTPADPNIRPRDFYFPEYRESEGIDQVHEWLMSLHRAGRLPPRLAGAADEA